MLPSTFEDKLKKEEEMKRRIGARLDLARFLQDTVAQMAVDMQAHRTGETQTSAAGARATGAGRGGGRELLGWPGPRRSHCRMQRRPRLIVCALVTWLLGSSAACFPNPCLSPNPRLPSQPPPRTCLQSCTSL